MRLPGAEVRCTALFTARRWYPDDRDTMQAFGKRPELQAAKIAETLARSRGLGGVVKAALEMEPSRRVSASQLAALEDLKLSDEEASRERCTELKSELESYESITGSELRAVCGLERDLHFGGVQRASLPSDLVGAVVRLNEDVTPYLHYMIDEVPADIVALKPEDFHLPRLRYNDPRPYTEAEYNQIYAWMVSWDLLEPESVYDQIVETKIPAE